MDFAQAVQRWHDFYMLVGTAAATLVGLTFIGISFAIGSTAERSRKDVDVWVTPALIYFLETFVIAAVTLAPVAARTIGILWGGLLLMNLPYGIMRLRYIGAQHRVERIEGNTWWWQLLIPAGAQLVLALGAVGALFDDARALNIAAISITLLLVVAIRNTWNLVIYLIEQR